jgi:DNA-binding MarR family transcriptional regulator
MHSLFFGLKRAYHATLHLTRRPLARIERGLTAARYDMLYAVQSEGGSIWQSGLRKMLGVTAVTVSRMVRRLEQLGMVVRSRSLSDRRQISVALTELGHRCVRRADAWLGHDVALAIDAVLTHGHIHSEDECLHAKVKMEDGHEAFRSNFGDTARFAYHPGWHPDD